MKSANQIACLLAALSSSMPVVLNAPLLAQTEARVLPVAGEEPGSPTCETFYDKWEMPGVPAAMLAMAGIGRELMAATDCLKKNDVIRACAHWRKVVEVTDRLGPPYNKDRAGLEALIRDHKCEANGLLDRGAMPEVDAAPRK